MHKKYNGYMTLEASFVYPVILWIFYILIILSVTWFMNCYKSQNRFIRELKESLVVDYDLGYRVIYNELPLNFNDAGGDIYHISPLKSISE